MKEYNDLNILTAIRTCCEKPGYKIGIADATAEQSCDTYDNAMRWIVDEEIMHLVRFHSKARNHNDIVFTNNSNIRFIRAIESNRGCAFHELLVAPGLAHTELEYIMYTEKAIYNPDGATFGL